MQDVKSFNFYFENMPLKVTKSQNSCDNLNYNYEYCVGCCKVELVIKQLIKNN